MVGLTAALRLLEEVPGARVHIVADKFGTDTLSDGAGGLWMPYALGSRAHRAMVGAGNGASDPPGMHAGLACATGTRV